MDQDLETKIKLEECESDIRIAKKMIEYIEECLEKVINDNYQRENKPIKSEFDFHYENSLWKLYIEADRQKTGFKDLNYNLSKLQEYQSELLELYETKIRILENS